MLKTTTTKHVIAERTQKDIDSKLKQSCNLAIEDYSLIINIRQLHQ